MRDEGLDWGVLFVCDSPCFLLTVKFFDPDTIGDVAHF